MESTFLMTGEIKQQESFPQVLPQEIFQKKNRDPRNENSFQKNKVNDKKVIPDPIDDRKFQE